MARRGNYVCEIWRNSTLHLLLDHIMLSTNCEVAKLANLHALNPSVILLSVERADKGCVIPLELPPGNMLAEPIN